MEKITDKNGKVHELEFVGELYLSGNPVLYPGTEGEWSQNTTTGKVVYNFTEWIEDNCKYDEGIGYIYDIDDLPFDCERFVTVEYY